MSEHSVGSILWQRDVRNFVADSAICSNQLLPPVGHLMLHVKRAQFVVFKYWGESESTDLSPSRLGGCSPTFGYGNDGGVLLEDVDCFYRTQKNISCAVQFCRCKRDCSTKRCFCNKKGKTCIRCQCNDFICSNRVETRPELEIIDCIAQSSLSEHGEESSVNTVPLASAVEKELVENDDEDGNQSAGDVVQIYDASSSRSSSSGEIDLTELEDVSALL